MFVGLEVMFGDDRSLTFKASPFCCRNLRHSSFSLGYLLFTLNGEKIEEVSRNCCYKWGNKQPIASQLQERSKGYPDKSWPIILTFMLHCTS